MTNAFLTKLTPLQPAPELVAFEETLRAQYRAILVEAVETGPHPLFWQPRDLADAHRARHGDLQAMIPRDSRGIHWCSVAHTSKILRDVFEETLTGHTTVVRLPYEEVHLRFFDPGTERAPYEGFIGRTGTVTSTIAAIESIFFFSEPTDAVLFRMRTA